MAYTPGNTGTKLDENFENDLLAIADTRLVLGNWYAECVMNGRSLPDFAAILGMCTSNYGHTRAIYQFLAAHGHDYAHLERGRDAAAICSMNILDEAPTAGKILSSQPGSPSLRPGCWHPVSSNTKTVQLPVSPRKIGEETYFHLKYAQGWFQIIGEGKKQSELFQKSFAKAFPAGTAVVRPGDRERSCA